MFRRNYWNIAPPLPRGHAPIRAGLRLIWRVQDLVVNTVMKGVSSAEGATHCTMRLCSVTAHVYLIRN